MQNAIKYTAATILLLGMVISAWFLVNNLQRFEPALYSLLIIIPLALILFLKLFFSRYLDRLKAWLNKGTSLKLFTPITMVFIALLGISARLYFYYKFIYKPVSDPLSYYDAAQKISSGLGMKGDNYIAFFPHLASYDSLLGLAMKIVPNPWMASIVLNTIFDLVAALVIYLVVKRLVKQPSRIPLVAFCVWFLSPFNILFSVLSLPIVIVNFFIVVTIFLMLHLWRALSEKKYSFVIVLSPVLGLATGIGDCFRPVFSIAIIALLLVLIQVILTHDKSLKMLLSGFASFVVVLTTFLGIQQLNTIYVKAQTGLDVTNLAGWNFYVGSNSESDGTWSEIDQAREKIICKNSPSNTDCQAKLLTAGIDRYVHHGLSGTLNLVVRKFYRFSSDQSVIYNANDSMIGYPTSRTAKLIHIYTVSYLLLLLCLSTRFLYTSIRHVLIRGYISPAVIFSALLMIGFFLSSVLVETSSRYAQIIYPVFMLFATLSLTEPFVGSKKISIIANV